MLVGRERELAVLHDRFRADPTDEPQVLLLLGEDGIGKSALLDAFLAGAQERWTTVTRATAHGGDGNAVLTTLLTSPVHSGPVPLSAAEPLRALRRAVADGTLRSSYLPYSLADAVLTFTEEVCSQGPCLLVLENLHLAEGSLLSLVDFLLRRLPDLPLSIIVSAAPAGRTDAMRATQHALQAAGGSTLDLGPLDEPAVQQLASHVLGSPPDAALADRLRAAGGNPALVLETLDVWREGGVPGPAALTLQAALQRRLEKTSPECVEVLRAAAMIGPCIDVSLLAAVTGIPVFRLAPLLAEARRHRLLRERAGRLEFSHEVVRESACATFPAAVRSALHQELARLLRAQGAPAARVVEHLVLGVTREQVEQLLQAGDDYADSEPAAAWLALATACELLPDGDRLQEVRTQLAGLSLTLGRVRRAEKLARAVLDSPHPAALVQPARVTLLRALAAQGRAAEAAELLDAPAMASFEPEVRLRLLADTALGALLVSDLDLAETSARRALLLDREHPSDDSAVAAGVALSYVCTAQGRCEEALTAAEAATRRAQRNPGLPHHRHLPSLSYAVALNSADRFDEVLGMWRETQALVRRWSLTWAQPSTDLIGSHLHWSTGDWDEAMAVAQGGLGVAGDSGVHIVTCSLLAVQAHVLLERGEVAHELLLAAESLDTSASVMSWVPWLRVLSCPDDASRGSQQDAAQRGHDDWSRMTAADEAWVQRMMGPDLLRLLLRTGRREEAEQVVDRLDLLAKVMGTDSSLGTATRARGLLAGDPEQCLLAVEQLSPVGRPLELAHACEDAAVLLHAAGRLREARDLAERATALCADLGARRTADRLAPLLGRRPRVAAPGRRPSRPVTGWESLTDAERRVSALVVDGATNQQIAAALFVSRHTVESHLKHVYTKLGLRSRAQLAVEVTRRAHAVEE